jgi:hypothetical protein
MSAICQALEPENIISDRDWRGFSMQTYAVLPTHQTMDWSRNYIKTVHDLQCVEVRLVLFYSIRIRRPCCKLTWVDSGQSSWIKAETYSNCEPTCSSYSKEHHDCGSCTHNVTTSASTLVCLPSSSAPARIFVVQCHDPNYD